MKTVAFLIGLGLALAVLAWLAIGPSILSFLATPVSGDTDLAAWPETAPLQTRQGEVVGLSKDGVLAFLGLRYAEPPTGERRFQPPLAAAPWEGTFKATTFPNMAMQVDAPSFVREPNAMETSEDSLFLNVFTPSMEGKYRPVLVWIHGGSFTNGSGNGYMGDVLARQGDVVVVSINYRLGVFGYLDLSGFDDAFAGSASNGVRDQILALSWVRDNIGDYGGNASNVTIFGESAGATSVAAIMASPSADGLYHKAIMHSGIDINAPPDDHRLLLAEHLEVETDALLATLKKLTAEELLAAQQAIQWSGGGKIDGTVVTRPGLDAVREHGRAGVPVIAGSNRDEGTLFSYLVPRFAHGVVGESVAKMVTRGEDPAAHLNTMKAAYPQDDRQAHFERIWTEMFRVSMVRMAETASEADPGGWLYRFDKPVQRNPPGAKLGATHAADIGFTFNTFAGDSPDEAFSYDRTDRVVQALALNWSNTVIQFARTGNPNGAGLPVWPRYMPGDRRSMVLDDYPRVEKDLDGRDQARWAETLPW